MQMVLGVNRCLVELRAELPQNCILEPQAELVLYNGSC